MRDSLLVTGQENVQKELNGLDEKRKVVKDNLDKIEKSVASESGKAALAKVRTHAQIRQCAGSFY